MATNITIRVDDGVAREMKILAAKKGTSLSAMAAEFFTSLTQRDTAYEQARKRHLALMRRGFNMGTHGKATWTRDELHER